MAANMRTDTGTLAIQSKNETPAEAAAQGKKLARLPGSTLGIVLALLAVYVIWGSTYFAIRVGLEGFPPFLMAGLRFIIAGGLLFIYLKIRREPSPTLRQWGASTLVGLLLLLGGNGLVTFAEQWVASGLAALAIATVPIWAALFAGLWGRWPRRVEWAGLLLGFAGVVILNLEGDMRANPVGAVALLAASGSWALGSVWSRYLPLPGGMMASAAQMLSGGTVLMLTGLFMGERITEVPGPRPMLAFIYLVLFGAVVGYSAYGYLLQKVRPSLATSYAYVNPVVAVALGVWLGGEMITWVGLAAMPVILAGVAIVVLARKR